MSSPPDLGQPGVDLNRGKVNLKKLRDAEEAMKGEVKTQIELHLLSALELYALRERIDELLPTTSLSEMDLGKEIASQYNKAKLLQQEATDNREKGVTEKDRGHLARMATTTLESLIKLQNSVYTAERLKLAEIAMETAFKEQSDDVKQTFFDKYKDLLGEQANKSRK